MRSFNTEPTDTDTDGHTQNSFFFFCGMGFCLVVVVFFIVLGGAFFEPQVRSELEIRIRRIDGLLTTGLLHV